jgi:hypothetical protein
MAALVSLGALAMALLGTTSASAATEAGNKCTNVAPAPPYALFTASNSPGGIPAAAPVAGVVTSWSVNFPPAAVVPQQLKVARLVAPPNIHQVTAESTTVNIVQGLNTFSARIPVQAGDIFGLYGTTVTIFCSPVPGSVLVGYTGDVKAGQSQPFLSDSETAIPVSVLIEPDADNDGFGDETQDQCPQSAALQAACPVTVLDSFALPKKGKTIVIVATSQTASVTVTGTAKLPRAKKGKKAGSSAQAKLAKVTKTVEAGKITRFTLNFPGKLKSALADLPKGKSVTLNLTATAPNLTGPATTDKAKLKLKG